MTEIRAPYAGRTLPVGTAAERDLRDEISQLRVQLAELDSFNNDLLGDVARLQASVKTLETGIKRLRQSHPYTCAINGVAHAGDRHDWEGVEYAEAHPRPCDCGADKHNRAIDALLKGET